MLTKAETTRQVNEMLAAGQSRASVYQQLVPQVKSEPHLARAVARYVSPETRARHKGKLDWLMVIIGLQIIGSFFFLMFALGPRPGTLVAALIVCGWLGWLARLMYKANPWGYTLFFLTSLPTINSNIDAMKVDPVASSIGLLIVGACIGYAFYVQSKLLPYIPGFNQVLRSKTAKYAFLEDGPPRG